MKVAPWSHSALTLHDTCAYQFQRVKVIKDLPPEAKSPEQDWGIYVHQQFEWKVSRPGFELPIDLQIHAPYLDKLIEDGEKPGCMLKAERKVALSNNPFGPCEYFDKSKPVWWRGVIDAQVIDIPNQRARISDYKTGKKKNDWEQLAENALWTFLEYPEVNLVNAQYYWVVDQSVTKKVWARHEIDELIGMFKPKLEAYVQSFKTDTWPKKQSGLCRGWCRVTDCDFWEPKKDFRK